MIHALVYPDRKALFLGFFKVGITAFGGVLPLVRRMLVDERHWVDDHDFTQLLGFSQVLPGPNVMNIAIAIGMRFQGTSGALCAVAGLMVAPVTIIIGLGALYDHYSYSQTLQHMLAGLATVAAGLMASMGIRLAMRLRRRGWHYPVGGLTFAGVTLLHLPLLVVLLPMAPLAIFMAWRERRAGGEA
jgi:chromate transporter